MAMQYGKEHCNLSQGTSKPFIVWNPVLPPSISRGILNQYTIFMKKDYHEIILIPKGTLYQLKSKTLAKRYLLQYVLQYVPRYLS